MEQLPNHDLTSVHPLDDFQVDIPPPQHSIQTIELDSTPILFEFVDDSSPSPKSRRSRSAVDKPGRPMNAFFFYRSAMCKDPDGVKRVEKDNRHVSRITGLRWKELSEEEKAPFFRMADQAKLEHKKKYPDYHFAPVPRSRPARKRKVKRASKAHLVRSAKIAEFIADGLNGDALDEAVKKLDETEPIVEEAEEDARDKGKQPDRKRKVDPQTRKRQRSSANTDLPPARRVRSRTETPSSDDSESSQSDAASPAPITKVVFRSPLLPPGPPSLPGPSASGSGIYNTHTPERDSSPIQLAPAPQYSSSMLFAQPPEPPRTLQHTPSLAHGQGDLLPAAPVFQNRFQPPQGPPPQIDCYPHHVNVGHGQIDASFSVPPQAHPYWTDNANHNTDNQTTLLAPSASSIHAQPSPSFVHRVHSPIPARPRHPSPQLVMYPQHQQQQQYQYQYQMHFDMQHASTKSTSVHQVQQVPSPLFTSRLTTVRQSSHFPSSDVSSMNVSARMTAPAVLPKSSTTAAARVPVPNTNTMPSYQQPQPQPQVPMYEHTFSLSQVPQPNYKMHARDQNHRQVTTSSSTSIPFIPYHHPTSAQGLMRMPNSDTTFSSPESSQSGQSGGPGLRHGPNRYLQLPRSNSSSPELGSPLGFVQVRVQEAAQNAQNAGNGEARVPPFQTQAVVNTNTNTNTNHSSSAGGVMGGSSDSVDLSGVLGMLQAARSGDSSDSRSKVRNERPVAAAAPPPPPRMTTKTARTVVARRSGPGRRRRTASTNPDVSPIANDLNASRIAQAQAQVQAQVQVQAQAQDQTQIVEPVPTAYMSGAEEWMQWLNLDML